MFLLRSFAHRLLSLLGLVALLIAIPARAGDDPYTQIDSDTSDQINSNAAEPTGNYQTVFVEAFVNGDKTDRLVRLRNGSSGLEIFRESAETLFFRTGGAQETWLKIDSLEDIAFEYEPMRGRVMFHVAYLESQANQFDLTAPINRPVYQAAALTALIVDYDLTATVSNTSSTAAGLFDGRLVKGSKHLASAFILRANGEDSGVIRLDSKFVLDNPDAKTRLTIGDFISAAPSSARSVRMAGVQFGSNFALQPGLITYPLPDFSGNLAVPSQIDLIVNDRRQGTVDLEAGSFSLRNIPAASGRQDLQVVVRDSLNRERLITSTTYVSRALLAPGLREWGGNIGFIRRGFGTQNDEYETFAASGLYRQSLSSKLTMGLSGEARNGLINIGLEATTVVANLFEVNGTVRSSWSDMSGQPSRSGQALSLAARTQFHGLSASLSSRVVTGHFDDLASSGGDRPLRSFVTLNTQFDLGDFGKVGVTAIQEFREKANLRDEERASQTTVRASWRLPVRENANFTANTTWQRTDGRTSIGAFIGLSVSLGPKLFGNTSYNYSNGFGSQYGASLRRPDILPGDIGYSFDAVVGVIDQFRAEASYLGEKGRISAQAEQVAGQSAARVNARGTLVFGGGNVFATRQISGAMVLVKTRNIPGLVITKDNVPQASSSIYRDAVLIPGLQPHVPMRIGVDNSSLSPSVSLEHTSLSVSVPGHSLAVVDLGIREFRRSVLRLRLPGGSIPQAGTVVTASPSGSEYMIGFDGLLEFDLSREDRSVRFERSAGEKCLAALPIYASESSQVSDSTIMSCSALATTGESTDAQQVRSASL